MDNCIQSFNVNVIGDGTFSAPDCITWVNNGDRNFSFESTVSPSTIDIEGFKKLDLYGMSVNGYVTNKKSAVIGAATILDWMFQIQVIGTPPAISAKIKTSPNYFLPNLNNTDSNYFFLSKYTNKINFETPITGVSNIRLDQISASGINAQTGDNVSLAWKLGFVFYYKYEGE
jgi:hypothetical protein